MIEITQLLWDDWNIEHIARHKVIPSEVEEVCSGNPLWHKTYNDRLRVIGLTKENRALTVILAPKNTGVFYPVTARPASRKERQRYTQTLTKEAA